MKPHYNHVLFSNYYLDELLPREDEFKASQSAAQKVFNNIKGLWSSVKQGIASLNEDQLRKHFLDRVFEMLGWAVDVEPPIPSGGWSKHPDYGLFPDKNKLQIAQKAPKEEYFKQALCIGEAKRWGRPLDKKLKAEKDPFEMQNPSLQISRYLWLTEVKWGILTDGKYWRLYERETSKRLDIYYEVDLEELLENGSAEDFRYFYLFFAKESFPAFIEKVFKESVDYAQAVGKELKENVYEALRVLAEGFLRAPENNLKEEHLKEIHDNSLILLYRLLFILYAEYRGLLPLGENKFYSESYSLNALKKEIAGKLDKNEPLAMSTFGYWNRLKELFEVINKGNAELAVPPYNGGLFDPERHPFLERYRMGDSYIARAINLVSRTQDKAYIDYSSLEIRHLGSIYEGLLEYKLKMAEDDLVSIKEKGKEVFVSLAEAQGQKKKINQGDMVRRGEVYLVTDKGERKATGSYYTPDYIVRYIVENTLGPLIEEKRKKIADRLREIKERIKKTRGYNRKFYEKELHRVEGSLLDEVFSIKVLDPAMGSGHFLVEATDFLARELLRILSGEPLEDTTEQITIKDPSEYYGPKESEEHAEEDIRWARREVVERCIFGVDLNPLAVELAKLSLWLYTVAKNRPLNFLDHHLRCGNSLIGARIEDLASLPEIKKKKAKAGPVQLGLFESIFREKVNILLGSFAQIEMLPSDTVEQIREKEKFYRDFRKIVSRFQDVADVWTSVYFGNEEVFNWYSKLDKNLRGSDQEWAKLEEEPWFKQAKAIAEEKCFFHWELEFPEVFFEGQQKKDNPGFDVVIGNPPYDVISEKEQKKEISEDKLFFSKIPRYMVGIGSKLNFYRLFITLSLDLMRREGRHGFIVPMALLADKQANLLRKFILKKNRIKIIEAFPQKDDPTDRVFEEAKLSTCVYVMKKTLPDVFSVRVHQGKDILETSPILNIEPRQIEEFDKENLSIPCFPGITTMDFQLALKLIKISKGSTLGDFAPSQQGEVNLTTHTKFFTGESKGQIVLRGAHVDRYKFQEEPKQGNPVYLDVQKFLTSHGKDTKAYDHRYIRIGYQRGAAIDNWRRIIATTIEAGNFCSDTVNYIVNPKQFNIYTVLALLNSSVWEWRFRLTSTNNHVNAYEIDSMPIRHIAFVTPKAERERLVEEFKGLYYDLMKDISGEKELDLVNGGNLLKFIEELLQKKHQPEAELVKKHNADPLNKDWQIPEGALWEQSDVVHDILAFLAEQMIELNKEKQKEIKGFLEWLEHQLQIKPGKTGKTGLEALTGKSQLKNYLGDYQKGEPHLVFDEFWQVLEKNKAKIGANLSSRKLWDTIKREYQNSLAKLLPLKEKLRLTDHLIDQIVYRLYGLTEEEIRIVEQGR
jgi:Alw26I/Eco31I/Esp3I family type II restriction m6 adenine DNA methyltransferase